jgi:DNA repair protein RecN (Recombination protein N)
VPLAAVEGRLRGLAAELDDVAAELRAAEDRIEADPARLDAVRARRQLLRDLQRKYGEGRVGPSLAGVLAYRDEARRRLADLEGAEGRAEALEAEREQALAALARAAAAVAATRRTAAPGLAAAVEEHLQALAMPGARLKVDVDGPGPADDVTFLLGANPGEPLLPLAKVASGGELARAMLALRLVLTAGPPTLVFDEVDAGIGGRAALAVGRALASVAAGHQVLVVTHLPQVAAFADHQVAVEKAEAGGRTLARAHALGPEERIAELSRMLSGQPGSTTAHDHAAELLATAAKERGR